MKKFQLERLECSRNFHADAFQSPGSGYWLSCKHTSIKVVPDNRMTVKENKTWLSSTFSLIRKKECRARPGNVKVANVLTPGEELHGASDFLGLGHFTTRYITERNYPSGQGPSYQNDRDLVELVDPNWPDLGSKWLYSVPWGFRRLLNFAQVTTLS